MRGVSARVWIPLTESDELLHGAALSLWPLQAYLLRRIVGEVIPVGCEEGPVTTYFKRYDPLLFPLNGPPKMILCVIYPTLDED